MITSLPATMTRGGSIGQYDATSPESPEDGVNVTLPVPITTGSLKLRTNLEATSTALAPLAGLNFEMLGGMRSSLCVLKLLQPVISPVYNTSVPSVNMCPESPTALYVQGFLIQFPAANANPFEDNVPLR